MCVGGGGYGVGVNERIASCKEIGSDGCMKNILASFITVRTRIRNASSSPMRGIDEYVTRISLLLFDQVPTLVQ